MELRARRALAKTTLILAMAKALTTTIWDTAARWVTTTNKVLATLAINGVDARAIRVDSGVCARVRDVRTRVAEGVVAKVRTRRAMIGVVAIVRTNGVAKVPTK